MKRFTALILSIFICLSLSACADTPDTAETSSPPSSAPTSSVPSTPSSSAPASSEDSSGEDLGGLKIDYTSIAKGYIDHVDEWEFKTIKFPGFESMDDEVLILPKGAIIICESSFAVYCYQGLYNAQELKYRPNLSKALGQNITATKDVQLQSGTYTTTEKTVVRFSVRGKLSDVHIFTEKGMEDQVILMTEADYIAEYLA